MQALRLKTEKFINLWNCFTVEDDSKKRGINCPKKVMCIKIKNLKYDLYKIDLYLV